MFSDSVLNEIRSRCDIVDVVGRYVSLKKSGQGYQGLCPFHSEKTPSFHVSPVRQMYRCFGSCNKGGNVFTFLMEHEGISFPEAVKKLAQEVGVKVEEDKRFVKTGPKPLTENQERALAALNWATKYFNHLLTQDPQYRFALKYLEKRGLSEKSISKFKIGVSPRGWNTLIGLMTKRGFKWEELLTAGLVVEKEGSKHQGYDRFRERLMFPITDKNGNVVGFGARALKEGDEPKYLNSPDTPLFNKSRILYGLHENQREIRVQNEALVVEGYMDVVGLFERGVCNAVAPMGTALTLEHCREIKSLTSKIITVFDPDAAGISAWHRSMPLFLEAGIFAKDVTLSGGLDPDEFVKQEGAKKFSQLCDQAPQQVTKYLKEIAEKGVLGEKDRTRHLQELTPILSASKRFPDKGALLWDDVSKLLNISLEALEKLVQQSGQRGQAPKPPFEGMKRNLQKPPQTNSKRSQKNPLDWEFFRTSLLNPDSFFTFPKENWLGFVKDPDLEKVLSEAWDTQNKSKMLEKLEAFATTQSCPELSSVLSELLVTEESPSQSDPKLFLELAKRIEERKRAAEIRGLANQVRLSQRLGDGEEQLKLLEQLRNIKVAGLAPAQDPPSPKSGPHDH